MDEPVAHKITRRENFRVEVRCRDFHYSKYREQFEEDACEGIKEQIERHVDDVAEVDVVCDTIQECSECGGTWEPDNKDGRSCANCGAPVEAEEEGK